MYQTQNEPELLAQLKNDCVIAFTTIFERYREGVYSMAVNLVRDQTEAKDIAQEVFSDLWQSRKVLVITTSLRNYLLTSARNKGVNVLRSKKVHKKYIELSSFTRESGPSSGNLENKNTLHYIATFLETLHPPLMAEAFKLVRIEGLSHEESAIRLGITARSSRTYAWLAFKKLKAFVKKQSQ